MMIHVVLNRRFHWGTIALLLFLVCGGCKEDSTNDVIGPQPSDISQLIGYWESIPYDGLEPPFSVVSFGANYTGILGTTDEMQRFSWSFTDSTISLELLDGYRVYHYKLMHDTLTIWVVAGERFPFMNVAGGDTVYIEENPEVVALSMPESGLVQVDVRDHSGVVAEIIDRFLSAGVHTFLIEYPEGLSTKLYALDVLIPGKFFERNYRVISERGVVPEQAVSLATLHFDRTKYLDVEYEFARDSNVGVGDSFDGTRNQWISLPLIDRLQYLPVAFRHDINENELESYYWCIGVYTEQFGYGWDDSIGDSPDNYSWDGESQHLDEYREILGLE